MVCHGPRHLFWHRKKQVLFASIYHDCIIGTWPAKKSRKMWVKSTNTLQWRHNERDRVSNHQPHDCLLNRLFRHRWLKSSKLRITGLCAGNSPGTSELPAQRASNAENVSIWWRHYDKAIAKHNKPQNQTQNICDVLCSMDNIISRICRKAHCNVSVMFLKFDFASFWEYVTVD